MSIIDPINGHNDLARATKDIRNYLRDSAVMWWRRGDNDMVEWHEEMGDDFLDSADFYEKETAKASKELHRIVGSSDPMMYSRRRA